MILSVSRRTDIPAFYSEWFFNRLKEGYALVRNPMNIHQVSRIMLNPDVVDCIVFWSKNPQQMMPQLSKLKDYNFYFQFTLNPYGQDTEPFVPRKTKMIDTFKALADQIGAYRVIWRYDPIFLNEKYTKAYHADNFGKIAGFLNGYTEKVTISFVDMYSKTKRNTAGLKIKELQYTEKRELASVFAKIAQENSFLIDTCAEDIDLSEYGISHARCIDDNLIKRIIGCPLDVKKDKSQRFECGCVASVDIGAYNTCQHGCRYCYANYSNSLVQTNIKKHNPLSPLLAGEQQSTDICVDRIVRCEKIFQNELF